MIECLWRYPLKSALGESLEWLSFDTNGAKYDRRWACISEGGVVVSAKHPRRWGKLLYVAASVDPLDDGSVAIQIPGQPQRWAGTPEADASLSDWLGESVTLSREVPVGARIHRLIPDEPGLVPESMPANSGGAEMTTAIPGRLGPGNFVDFGQVHVVTLEELSRLSAAAGTGVEARRFRPNIVASIERSLEPGDILQIGNAVRLRVLVPTPRCAVPGAAQAGLDPSPDLLRAIGRRRTEIPGLGMAACVGVYAEVLTEGRVSVRDTVRHVAKSVDD